MNDQHPTRQHRQPGVTHSQAQPSVERLLTPDEVCAALAVRKEWLYAQVQRQQLAAVRLNGRSLRFKAADVQSYIDRQYGQVG